MENVNFLSSLVLFIAIVECFQHGRRAIFDHEFEISQVAQCSRDGEAWQTITDVEQDISYCRVLFKLLEETVPNHEFQAILCIATSYFLLYNLIHDPSVHEEYSTEPAIIRVRPRLSIHIVYWRKVLLLELIVDVF